MNLGKILFFPIKMISIREDDKAEKQLFYSIQQASDKTGIPSEVIDEVLQRESSSGSFSSKVLEMI